MSRVNHVMLASDLSAPARHAAERAAFVARDSQARLCLMHVAAQPPLDQLRQLLGVVPPDIGQQIADQARQAMQQLAEHLFEHRQVAASVEVASGDLLAALRSQAATLPADLVVLGARGASFMRHILLGSTAERLLSSLPVPMLVVKQAAHESYRKLLVPVDFSPASLAAVTLARAVAPQAELILLHACEPPFEGMLRYAGVDEAQIQHYRQVAYQEAQSRLHALAAQAALPAAGSRCLVVHGNASQSIIEQEQEQDCDLIVMGKHGATVVEQFLLGSVTRHVLAEAQGDVLVSL